MNDATAFVTSSLVRAQNRYVPSSTPTLHRPTVWWDKYCQRTYLTKLRLWNTPDSDNLGKLLVLQSLLRLVLLRYINGSFRKDCRRDPMIEYGGKQLSLLVLFVLHQPDLLQMWRTSASILLASLP